MARVLIIEDEAITAQAIAEELQKHNHEIVGIAATGADALHSARINEPDVALVDIVLKGRRDGVLVAEQLREEFDLAILFLTSATDNAVVSRAITVAPEGYLVKPVRPADVHIAIRTALAQHRSRSSVTQRRVTQIPLPPSRGLSPHQIATVRQFVDRNFNRDIKVSTLAELCELSDSHFAAQFKRSTDCTPAQFIAQQRIEEAKRLLMTTDWSTAEIARSIGFDRPSYFSTVFKRFTGLTPTEYRRR
ncbi:MAG: response regulator transcription factor [Pseudomonadota bacterium]